MIKYILVYYVEGEEIFLGVFDKKEKLIEESEKMVEKNFLFKDSLGVIEIEENTIYYNNVSYASYCEENIKEELEEEIEKQLGETSDIDLYQLMGDQLEEIEETEEKKDQQKPLYIGEYINSNANKKTNKGEEKNEFKTN